MRGQNIEGIVSDLQRFSLHDGPGIRTTVFMKGCPMRCFWCHNPETWARQPQLRIALSRCTGCGACLEACAAGAIRLKQGAALTDRALCVGCGACTQVCATGARSVCGRTYGPEALVEELMKDSAYYRNTGGGVTFSGGEPLMQSDFVAEAAGRLREKGVGVAVETALCVPEEALRRMLVHLTYAIADIKMLDEEEHRRATGVGLERILSNFEVLADAGIPLLVRTPVIPGVNDTREAIGRIAGFLRGRKALDGYELMPYHPYGEVKYEEMGLGRPAPIDARGLSRSVQALAESAREAGLACVRVSGA